MYIMTTYVHDRFCQTINVVSLGDFAGIRKVCLFADWESIHIRTEEYSLSWAIRKNGSKPITADTGINDISIQRAEIFSYEVCSSGFLC